MKRLSGSIVSLRLLAEAVVTAKPTPVAINP
jgi:hypothetical protein